MKRKSLVMALASILLFFCDFCLAENVEKCFRINKQLGRGMNLGNALEAPKEGDWGVTLHAEYFQLIKQAGFDSVRIPIRFSAHAQKEPPYTIDPDFFNRIDWAIKNSLDNGLAVIINIHHYEEIYKEPADHTERLIQIWHQIATRYKDQPETVLFELLNEPYDKLTDQLWNELFPKVLAEVRKSNPGRIVLIGPASWNNPEHFPQLVLPESDRNIIATFHYYQPFNFTHQGAPWMGEQSKEWLGITWTATPEQCQTVKKDLQFVADWAKQNNRPVNLGEFGVFARADMPSREKWTDFVARKAEELDLSWHYWEFCSGFGTYDSKHKIWKKPILNALIPPQNISP